MKLGIVVYSDDSESVWNAFRLGVFALKKGDSVGAFLLAKGVECESLNTEKFKVTDRCRHSSALVAGSLRAGLASRPGTLRDPRCVRFPPCRTSTT